MQLLVLEDVPQIMRKKLSIWIYNMLTAILTVSKSMYLGRFIFFASNCSKS